MLVSAISCRRRGSETAIKREKSRGTFPQGSQTFWISTPLETRRTPSGVVLANGAVRDGEGWTWAASAVDASASAATARDRHHNRT